MNQPMPVSKQLMIRSDGSVYVDGYSGINSVMQGKSTAVVSNQDSWWRSFYGEEPKIEEVEEEPDWEADPDWDCFMTSEEKAEFEGKASSVQDKAKFAGIQF